MHWHGLLHVGKGCNLLFLKITAFERWLFYKNNRFCQLMVFKITGFSVYLPFAHQNLAIGQKRAHTSPSTVIKTTSEVVIHHRPSLIATKACF